MKAQLFQVFRTYIHRPLVLLFAAIALLLAIGLFAMGLVPRSANIPIAPEIRLTGNLASISVRGWDDHFQDHAPAELDSLLMTDMAIPRGLEQKEGMFPDLTSLVNLTTLELDSANLTLSKVQEVQSLENLQSLALQAPAIPEGTWTALGPKLRELEIPIRLLLSHPDEVSQLVELRMLRVDRVGLTPEALSVIAQIPNLKHLVLSYGLVDMYEDQSDSRIAIAPFQLAPATLRPLAGHPSLEAIFAQWPPETPRTIPELPGVQLYPSGYPTAWQGALLLGLFFTAAIAVIVAVQVWAHFVVQTAAVVPGYTRPHQLAAIFILLGGSLVGAIGLWLSEIALFPGLIIALGIPTACLAILTALQSPSPTVRTGGVLLGFLAGAIFWWPMAMAFSLPPAIAGELVWFLRGDFPLIALLILFGECVLLAWAFVQLPRLTRRVYEKSSLRPGLSPWDPQQQRRAYETKNWWMRLIDRGESYDRLRGDSNWQMARLWQAGNGYRPRNAILFGGMFIVFYIAMQMLIGGGGRFSDPTMWHAVMIQLGIFALLPPAAAWGRRCGSLPVESLRPVSRKNLVRQLFTALALDQSLAIVPFAIVIALSIAFPREGGSVAESFSFIALGLVALVWIYAVSTGVFAFKQDWVLVGYIVAAIVFPVVCFTSVAIIGATMKMPADRQILQINIASLALLVLAAGTLGTTYRQSLRREWG